MNILFWKKMSNIVGNFEYFHRKYSGIHDLRKLLRNIITIIYNKNGYCSFLYKDSPLLSENHVHITNLSTLYGQNLKK